MLQHLARSAERFIREEDGAALVEYGILIALIAVVCIILVALVGNKISAKFSEIDARMF